MQIYFEIPIEFNHEILEERILTTSVAGKGYCCFVDATVMVNYYHDKEGKLKTILNNALVNSCDGSYFAMMANIIYKQNYAAYNGPQFFSKFIYWPNKQCIIGNTAEVFEKIKKKLELTGGNTKDLYFIPLPYCTVDNFNYQDIASNINKLKPQFIWISLGAPKQEEFMYRILPFIDKGVLLGVGAALNFFSGAVKEFPKWIKKLHLIWLFRIFTEPRKQIPRSLNAFFLYPRIFFKEYKKVKQGVDKKSGL